jgi:hypothetical protein
MFCILVPWCKCHVSRKIFFNVLGILILNVHFSRSRDFVYCWPCLVPHVKVYSWYSIHFWSYWYTLEGWLCGEKMGSFRLIWLSFSFLDPKVNNLDRTFQCPLRNQKDILDDPIPSKLTLSVYSIWIMKCRFDPKYAPQYKSKHTNYVKLSKKVFKPLDTQK